MRGVVCRQFGPITGLSVEEVPPPQLTDDGVRIQVKAIGVNFVDLLVAEGKYQVLPDLPFTPGSEVCGIVTEVGQHVTALAPGDRVVARPFIGGFAEQVVAPAHRVLLAPSTLTDTQAATFLQSYITAWYSLTVRAEAVASQSILVLGAGSGVGLAAVDVGRALGLRVLAGASSEAKRALALSKGADVALDTTVDDFKTLLRSHAGDGLDLVYDPVGGALTEIGLRCLGEHGQLLVIGFASGNIPMLRANLVLLRNRRITGVDWGGWLGNHPAEAVAVVARLVERIEAGDLQPIEPETYSLDDVELALSRLQRRDVVGKVALLP